MQCHLLSSSNYTNKWWAQYLENDSKQDRDISLHITRTTESDELL